jgi:predicted nucleotidyltransferase component of viral defense system
MLTLAEIEKQYPEFLRKFPRDLLREYLQYKILEIIFMSDYAPKLSFLGGTALRIIHNNQRFSEDLDFDNFSLKDDELEGLSNTVKSGLESDGLKTEMSLAGKGAYRCNIRLPDILFANQLSQHTTEKILIHIDSAAHNFRYKPDTVKLNKFGVYSDIFVTPPDIILSQKICAAIGRKRPKGRDFFDIMFLLSFVKPNYEYLKVKLGTGSGEPLRKLLTNSIANFDFKALGRDVQSFLFNADDVRRVEDFPNFLAQAKLE